MVEMMSEQFSSVFSQPKHPLHDPGDLFPDQPSGADTFSDVLFTENDLIEAMNDVSSNSAAGPDGFPAIFLKKSSHVLARPLAMIWRRSMNTGIVPAVCKFANIIPIHKGKSRAVAKKLSPCGPNIASHQSI